MPGVITLPGLMGPPRGSPEPTSPTTGSPPHLASATGGAGAGSPRAVFDDAHDRLAGWVRARFAARVGLKADLIDDLSQRTWAAVWRALEAGTYDPTRSAMPTFVYAVSENIWRQHAKTSARAGERAGPVDDDLPGFTGEPSEAVQAADRLERLRDCLRGQAGLRPEDVQVLQLLSRGVTDRALAEQLGVAPSTAHARKRAALEALRRALSPERERASGEEPLGRGV